MLWRCRPAVLAAIVAAMAPGCAYQLHTGYRDLDGGCHCLEKVTAPLAKAVAWTGGLVGLGAATVATGYVEDQLEDGEYVPKSNGGSKGSGDQSGDDTLSSSPAGKPLR